MRWAGPCLILIKAPFMRKHDPANGEPGLDWLEPRVETIGISMRLRKTICGFLLVLAIALLPLANGATACTQIPQDTSANETTAGSIVSTADYEPLAQNDDCCLTHGTQGDPCSSAACCTFHCTAVPSASAVGTVYLPKPLHIVPLIRDQVFVSTIGSPPFRPPRA